MGKTIMTFVFSCPDCDSPCSSSVEGEEGATGVKTRIKFACKCGNEWAVTWYGHEPQTTGTHYQSAGRLSKAPTPDELAREMRAIHENEEDTEDTHREMDGVLCRVLYDMGFCEAVGIFNEQKKWYS